MKRCPKCQTEMVQRVHERVEFMNEIRYVWWCRCGHTERGDTLPIVAGRPMDGMFVENNEFEPTLIPSLAATALVFFIVYMLVKVAL